MLAERFLEERNGEPNMTDKEGFVYIYIYIIMLNARLEAVWIQLCFPGVLEGNGKLKINK